VQAREAAREPAQLFFTQHRLDAREDLILFEADVVVEPSAEGGQLRLKVAFGRQRGGQRFDAGANVGVLGQHLQNSGFRVQWNVAGEGGQQHFFFLTEVEPPGGLPEAEVVAGDAAKRPSSRCARLPSAPLRDFDRINGAADEEGLHQGVVVVLAQGVQAGVTLHRPRGYYFFRVRT
jgi:hypothetical protein